MVRESEVYPLLLDELERKFKPKTPIGGSYHLELTFTGEFSNSLKREVHHDIVFSFLKRTSPDITGFLKSIFGTDFITVEIKRRKLVLEDIYQAKRYADLFNAKYGFLLSSKPVPEEIKRLANVSSILRKSKGGDIRMAQFDENTGKIFDYTWFPANQFEEL